MTECAICDGTGWIYEPVEPIPVSPSGQRCGVLCGKCGTAAEMHVCPNGAYHFLRNEFTETWPPVKPNQGNKSPGTDRPADPSPVSSGLRVERERTCKRCGLELAWQSGYEQWTHKRSGLPFCNLSADPSLQVSPELKLLRVIQKFLYGYQLSEPLGGYRAWNEGISSACAQLFDPQENGEVLKALGEYRESRVTAPVRNTIKDPLIPEDCITARDWMKAQKIVGDPHIQTRGSGGGRNLSHILSKYKGQVTAPVGQAQSAYRAARAILAEVHFGRNDPKSVTGKDNTENAKFLDRRAAELAPLIEKEYQQ